MSWLSHITPALIERARQRPGTADPRGQFGAREVVDHRAQDAQDEADRARYADRYRDAYAKYRRAMGYDDPEEGDKRFSAAGS